MRKPNDKPNQSDLGQWVSECVQAFNIAGAQAIQIFGGTPNERNWKRIMDDGKAVMKDFPKA